jgi:uncharacterized protein
VYLSQCDLTKLCQWFNFTEEKFIDDYCRWVPYYDGSEVLCLKETSHYDCILWNHGCSVYECRPVQCAVYPFWTSLLASSTAWNNNGKMCPGINFGKLWTLEEIQRLKALYEKNEPVHRNVFLTRKVGE